jgi:acyl carrier protein
MPTNAPDDILAAIQRAYDVVVQDDSRILRRADELIGDLDLDSLDFIDLVSQLGEWLPPEAIDAVLDEVGGLRTVGDVVDRLAALGVTPVG